MIELDPDDMIKAKESSWLNMIFQDEALCKQDRQEILQMLVADQKMLNKALADASRRNAAVSSRIY